MDKLLKQLPEDIENLIYKYEHQMKMKNVLDELLVITEDFNKTCCSCKKDYCTSREQIYCVGDLCNETFCYDCYIEEINYHHSMEYFEPNARQIERRIDINRPINVNSTILCNNCSNIYDFEPYYNAEDNDLESIPEDWEDLDMLDRYGSFSGY